VTARSELGSLDRRRAAGMGERMGSGERMGIERGDRPSPQLTGFLRYVADVRFGGLGFFSVWT
jgi:hypothetical protein